MRLVPFVALLTLTTGVVAQPAPRLTVSASVTRVATYDTLGGIVATPRTLDGKVAATSPVKWAVTPSGVASVITLDGVGHSIALAGLAPGAGHLVATWRSFPGTAHIANGAPVLDVVTLQDSLIITVTAPTVTIRPFNVVTGGVPSMDIMLKNYCLYAAATDKRGTYYQGIQANWSTNDTTWLRQFNNPPCVQVTVDPRLLPVPLPTPPQ